MFHVLKSKSETAEQKAADDLRENDSTVVL